MTDVPPERDTVVIGGPVPSKLCTLCGDRGEWPGQPCPDCSLGDAVLPAPQLISVPTEITPPDERPVARSKYDRAVLNNQRLRNLLADVALFLEGEAIEDLESHLTRRADLRARVAELVPLNDRWPGELSRSRRDPRR